MNLEKCRGSKDNVDKLYGIVSKKMDRLFVYGTLAPGKPNEQILAEIGGDWEEGYVLGDLLDDGWGADMGYPGIKLSKAGNKVHGFLFSSTGLKDAWSNLDAFEGEEYERVKA